MIFLDNASTTRVSENTSNKILQAMKEDFYNPSALYFPSTNVVKLIDNSRSIIAKRLGARNDEIFFTSCATESNNWVFASGIKNKKGNIVVSAGEHASVYESAMRKKEKGMDVKFAPLSKNGEIDYEEFSSLVDPNTCFVSVIHCSNETGVINDISRLSKIVKSVNSKAIVHSDGVQALCKTSNDVNELGVDLYSLSSHKIGGAKGTGVLYVRKGINLPPFIVGGGQEKSLRSGTENVGGIVGFGAAMEEFLNKFDESKMKDFSDYFKKNICKELLFSQINGNQESNSHCVLSISLQDLKAEILQNMLCDEDILIGLGSACASRSRNNRVLSQLGLNQNMINGSVRISFGIENTFEEIVHACERLIFNAKKLRGQIIG